MSGFVRGVAAVCVAGAMISGAAQAADLGRPPPPPPAMVYDTRPAVWTGFYVGGNIGAGWGGVDYTSVTTGGSGSEHDSQFIGGGQAGYNWQSGNLVLGVEGGFTWGSSNSSTNFGANTVSLDTNWMGTLVGRVGFAQDAWLFYMKAGGAWVDGDMKVRNNGTGAVTGNSDTLSGWLVGGGLEWAFAPRWSTRIDYSYIGLDSTDVTVGGNTFKAEPDIQLLTIGLNYRF